MEFKNKKILVCGMARSGIAAAKILCELGAKVTATDLKNEIEIEKNFFSNEKFFCDEKKFSHEEKNLSDDEKNSNDKKNFSDDEKNFSNDKKNFSNDKKNFSNDKKNFSNDKKNFSDAEKFFFLDGKKIIFRLGEDPVNFFHEFEHIIISPGISINAPFVKKARATGIPVWGEAELAYNLCPCPIIAITGTNGKTTVTTLVGEILKKFFTQKNVV
ncbi:MAG: hypothetical protein FWD19_02400, partial [Defluviitaleaceae bacterium]|nr:hypothetical protein [Defluviitaleaceae bacterium]